jgi:hypothetical protein
MGPNALLVCAERQSLKVLESLLDELEIRHDACHRCADAMERAVGGQYSALVLDFDLEGCAQIGKLARMAAPQQRSVLFALVGASTPLNDTSHAGANVVLYKPLNLDQVRCSLRAGRELMRADRRRDSRHRVETLVYLQFGVAAMPALVLDLSEQGLALQTPEPFPPVREVPLRFALPGTSHMIEAVGEVIWSDDSGRAGLFFSQLKPNSRKYLNNWLLNRGAKKRDAVRILLRPDRVRKFPRLSH